MSRKNASKTSGTYRFEYVGFINPALLADTGPDSLLAAGRKWTAEHGGVTPQIARLPGGQMDLTQPDASNLYVALNGGNTVALIGPFPSPKGSGLEFDRHWRAVGSKLGLTVANTRRKDPIGKATGNLKIFLTNLERAHPEIARDLIGGKAGKARSKAGKARPKADPTDNTPQPPTAPETPPDATPQGPDTTPENDSNGTA